MRNIYFYNDESNSVVLEKDNFENSIFKEQYIQALLLFQNILENADETKSNIIAFCGDRGEGKTSCMMTFKHILEHQEDGSVKDFLQSRSINKVPKSSEIDVLDVIELMFIDEKHDLRDLVLGRLYDKVVTCKTFETNHSAKKEVLKCFFQCKRYMKSLQKSREEMYEELEEIALLSGGISLKQKFNNLIETYLKQVQKKHLLLFIDDFDLNMKYAYEMMELIRKYFSSRHCVVILSCHITQLERIVNLNMQHENSSSNFLTSLGTKYINKLLPQNNRIYMPRVKDFCDWPLFSYSKRSDAKKTTPDYHSVKEAVVRLIFNKTHYLFYNSKNRVSSIVPNNLRSLRHIINMLLAMEDFKDNLTHEENKKRFKTFFFQVWTHQLSDRHLEFVQRLGDNHDVMSINKMVVGYLNQEFLQNKGLGDDNLWINAITNPLNSVYNVSVGDALTVIDYLEQRETDKDACLFLFFLQSFYSIKLYDFYDVVSEVEGNFRPSSQNSIDGEIYKNEAWFKQCNLLQRFVNGAYFSYNSGDFLPRSSSSSYPRDKKIINGEEFKLLVDSIQNYDQMTSDSQQKFQRAFQLFEYFALCIHRNIISKNKEDFYLLDKNTKSSSYRTLSEPHHLKEFSYNVGYFVYDVLALFANLLNVESAYSRFNDFTHGVKMYEFAKKQSWSLLNQMLEATKRAGRDGDQLQKEKCLLSDSTIRNAEIWMALLELMKQNRLTNKDGGGNKKLISSFYKTISSSPMKTYALKEDGNPHDLSFRFLKPIMQLLEDIDSVLFDKVFLLKDENESVSVQPSSVIEELFGDYLRRYTPILGSSILSYWRTNNHDLFQQIPADCKSQLNKMSGHISKDSLIQILEQYVDDFQHLVGSQENLENTAPAVEEQ